MASRKKKAEPSATDDRIIESKKTAGEDGTTAKPGAGFPVVGIGASAGGLAAFEAFFSGMPADTDPGMAFVLVQHLAPDHKSILTDLIRRYTRMKVFEVEDGMEIKPNCAYIIPPNRDMAFLNGTLQLMEPSAPRGQRLPIDFFFRSLAQDQHERAICIVLSGTGSDGTLGVRDIKGKGGMAMAQTPDSTEFDGMPLSAISTGLVDYVMPPAEMPAQLMAYVGRAFGSHTFTAGTPVPAPKIENALKKIFVLLRSQTGHDFSQYKPSTIQRRIERRMVVHQVETMDGYVRFLQQTPVAVESLFRDLLIGVTRFFRDPDTFSAVEKLVIPRLFAGKPANTAIRIWTPGCSTGEEAYSIAILLKEYMEAMKQSHKVQIFATDIDSMAVSTARAGIYPASIATDVTPERLSRYFTADFDAGTYSIHKDVRDMLVFSEQDIIRDPHFSRLDLITCRNLLIYMGGDLQKKLIPLFHYALNSGAFLFLGTSESVGDFYDLFTLLDRKAKLYQRKDDFHSIQHTHISRLLPPVPMPERAARQTAEMPVSPVKLSLREMTEQTLLHQIAPAAAMVNSRGDILYIHGRTGLFLEMPPGDIGINNILKMARKGLKRDLTASLYRAVKTKDIVYSQSLRVKTNGSFITANLTVLPVPSDSACIAVPLYLVIMEEAFSPDRQQAHQASLRSVKGTDNTVLDNAAHIEDLKQELRAKDEYLQTSNEELETSNEELKSANEEMQSVNEELQSTNEELETSKEELQSVNEELATVNAELQIKVADLSRANNDMNNLLAGTGIGTVFVDHDLHILRFTPAASRIINLIANDIGRPVVHIASNIVGYDCLVEDVQAVLNTLIPKDVEVQTSDGNWYAMRIQPYRTLDNVIEGAVITFVDITERHLTQELLQKATDLHRLAVPVRDARDAITVQDMDGRILVWNPEAVKMYGWSEAEALLMNIRDRIPEEMRADILTEILEAGRSGILEPCRTRRLARDGRVVDVWMTAGALVNESGQIYATTVTERADKCRIRGTADVPRQ